ncbi:MAG: 2-C-methyl-D-erythritol 2,4-cyclodiphosphate synthase [Treponemataceae bacterium]
MNYSLVIAASGNSTRMNIGKKKEFLPLISPNFPNEKASTVLSCAAEAFLLTAKKEPLYKLKSIVVACNECEQAKTALFSNSKIKELLEENKTQVYFVDGGKTRQLSVKNAMEVLKKTNPPEFVAIHDGARPWVDERTVSDCLEAAKKNKAAAPIIDVVDTIKEIDSENTLIKKHLKRNELGAIQTPQVFDFELLLKAHNKALKDELNFTDDTELWAHYIEYPVSYVRGNIENKKITYKDDVDLSYKNKSFEEQKLIKIGLGYDLHPLVAGRPLILGGVEIPSNLGEYGHSDGDVLLHALCDAILGAAGIGDIGEFFPPSDPKWKNADSKELLKQCMQKVKDAGWNIVNIDCVINIESPKILPYRNQIIQSIASILCIEKTNIFVKAKTGEKLGDIGQKKAVAVWATALLQN